MELPLLGLTLALAAANGANDVSKGIATLIGAGVSDLRRATLWGAVWTAAGCLAAGLAAKGLLATFSGKGILLADLSGPAFLAAVGLGACGWVAFATRTGLPVSTTHALVGGLCGAGLAAAGPAGIAWGAMARKVFASLALGPLISLALLYLLSPLLARLARRFDDWCLCLEGRGVSLVSGAASLQALEALRVGAEPACEPRRVAGVKLIDGLHWLCGGLTSFARGVNDAPKVLALGLAAGAGLGLSKDWGFALIAAAMGLGGLWAGRRVTETLSRKVARISAQEGLGASLVTALLVGSASRLGLPVSTTHVASGAIVAAGLRRGTGGVHWRMVGEIALAWVVTLPGAALLAAAAWRALA